MPTGKEIFTHYAPAYVGVIDEIRSQSGFFDKVRSDYNCLVGHVSGHKNPARHTCEYRLINIRFPCVRSERCRFAISYQIPFVANRLRVSK